MIGTQSLTLKKSDLMKHYLRQPSKKSLKIVKIFQTRHFIHETSDCIISSQEFLPLFPLNFRLAIPHKSLSQNIICVVASRLKIRRVLGSASQLFVAMHGKNSSRLRRTCQIFLSHTQAIIIFVIATAAKKVIQQFSFLKLQQIHDGEFKNRFSTKHSKRLSQVLVI